MKHDRLISPTRLPTGYAPPRLPGPNRATPLACIVILGVLEDGPTALDPGLGTRDYDETNTGKRVPA